MRTTSPRFEDSDVAFHYAIATIPKNPIYVVMHRAIIDWLVDQRRVTLSYPGQNRVAFDSHVAIFEAIKAHDPELAAPACARTWIRLASSTGRSGGRASERFMVTVEFKPKPTAMAASARSSMRMRRCHASANRGTSLALRRARIHGRTIASCFGKSMIAARPSHLQPPHFAAFDKTRADWS